MLKPRLSTGVTSSLAICTASFAIAACSADAGEQATASVAQPLRTVHLSGLIGGTVSASDAFAVATEQGSADSVVVGSFTGSIDVDVGPGTTTLTSHGDADAFVARYTAAGALVWSFALGGTGTEEAWGVAIAPSGHVLVTGYFGGSVDFDPGPGVVTLSSGTADEAFIAEYDRFGNFVWADHLVTSLFHVSVGTAIAVGSDGNFAWAGSFSGTISGPLQGSTPRTAVGVSDAFVALYDAGHVRKFFRPINAAGGFSRSRGVTVLQDGSVAAVGEFDHAVTLTPSIVLTPAGGLDGFVTRITPAGTFVFAKAIGGPLDEAAYGVASDPQSNILVAGEFQGTAAFPVPGGSTRTSAGDLDAYVASFAASSGNALWVNAFGGTGPDSARAISARGSLLTAAGNFEGTVDFNPAAPIFSLTSPGGGMFATQMSTNGAFVFAIGSSGPGGATARGVSLDSTGSSVIVGTLSGSEFMAPNTLTTTGRSGFFVRRKP